MRTKKPEQAERMLDAAARLFGHQRFHEVRMDDVANEAGVGKGTIYRYFEDKDQLYLALLDRAARQLHSRIREAVSAARTPQRKLEALAGASLEFFDEQPHVFDLIQRADALHGWDTPWQRVRDVAIELTQQIFVEARTTGEFAVADPEVAALMLLGGVRAVIRFGTRPHPRDLARRLVRTILFGAAGGRD
ncbi:MAG: TetR/AcrR family transcriptional regulator [Gemmataceae bacterium]